MILTLFVLSISAEFMFSCIAERLDKKKHYILILLICLAFGNVFSVELYLFPEYTLYNALGIFMAVCSAFLIKRNSKAALIWSCIALIIGLGFYQANIGYFLIISLTMMLLEEKEYKKYYLEEIIKILLIGGISCIFNIVIKKILVFMNITEEISRDAELNIFTIIRNLKIIIAEQYKILVLGDELLPKYTLIIFIAFAIFMYIFITYKTVSLINLISYLILILVEYLCIYAPHLIAGDVWLAPRTITSLFTFISCLCILVVDSLTEKQKRLNCVMFLSVSLLMALNFWAVQGIVGNHIATNKVDQEFAYCIYSEIEKYEQKSGMAVTNIATINDKSPMWKNRSINYYSYNINERAYINEWSDVTLVNFVSGKNYNKIDMDHEIYCGHFMGKDWDYYCPDEQLYFEGNTLYWCKY